MEVPQRPMWQCRTHRGPLHSLTVPQRHSLQSYTCQYNTRIDTVVSWEALDSHVMQVNISKQTGLNTLRRQIMRGLDSGWVSLKQTQTNGHVHYSFPDNRNSEFQDTCYFHTTGSRKIPVSICDRKSDVVHITSGSSRAACTPPAVQL